MYCLNEDRRARQDRRNHRAAHAKSNLSPERRKTERRVDTRPLDEFPFLPPYLN